MERKSTLINKQNEWLLWIFGIGLISHIIPTTRDSMIALTPIVLFLVTTYILHLLHKELTWKSWAWAISGYLMGFIVELIGVQTKAVFGSYEYSYTFGISIFGTPLLIGVLWLILVWGANELTSHLPINRWFTIPISATLVLLYDIILEPVAMHIGYWSWFRDIIPLQNYITWFILAFAMSIVYHAWNPPRKTKLFRDYFVVLFVFMLGLRIFLV